MTENDSTTYIHKFKCLNCQLHYAVYSWLPSWPEENGFGLNHCPECGKTEGKLHWVEPTENFIFQYVPGEGVMVGMGEPSD